ncbi:MAG: MoaD/ThiS family protein, partial [Acidobacteriota bacterium]
PDGSTIRDVIQRLGIPEDIATITLVNGHDASSEQILNEGDTVSMFPPLAGGCAGAAR